MRGSDTEVRSRGSILRIVGNPPAEGGIREAIQIDCQGHMDIEDADVDNQKKTLENRRQDLQERKDRLIDAHIIDRVIGRDDF